MSHRNKYLFIEMNHTGSTTVNDALCDYYSGKEILWKHARYRDFTRQATAEERGYFCFSGKRNPLDLIVTLYFRHKLDPYERLHDIQIADVTVHNYKLYRYIKKYNADFPNFFKKFFRGRIYYEWKGCDFKKLDYVYRFEQLEEEFANIIKRLGLTQIKPLLVLNQTAERSKDFSIYYSPDIQPWARIILRDLMNEWGYEFPSDWRQPTVWHWLYYYFFLKPMFYLRKIFHLMERAYCAEYIQKNIGIATSFFQLQAWPAF